MSLLMSIVGRTPGCLEWLSFLGLMPAHCGRFRDCYVNKDLEFVVFTRNGGGNREDQEEATAYLRAHPWFVRDYDDDRDCTYAYYVFRAPENEEVKKLLQEAYEKTTLAVGGPPMDRFDRVTKKLGDSSTPKDDPDLVRAMQVGKNILDPIMDSMKSKNPGVNVITVADDGTVKTERLDEESV